MRASTTALGHLHWSQDPGLTQLHAESRLDVRRGAQNQDTVEPFFKQRSESAGAPPTKVSFGPFRLLPTQFLLLEGECPSEAVLWKS